MSGLLSCPLSIYGQFSAHPDGWNPSNPNDHFGIGGNLDNNIQLKITSATTALFAWSSGSNQSGVYGYAVGSGGRAIQGNATSATGYAGHFTGRIRVSDHIEGSGLSEALGLCATDQASDPNGGGYLWVYGNQHANRPGWVNITATNAGAYNGGVIRFVRHDPNNSWRESMRIDRFGHVGIGTTNLSATGYRLFVREGIKTGRVMTDASLADYVFADDYEVMPLAAVDSFVQQHHHLPGVVSQAEVYSSPRFSDQTLR